MFSRYLLILLVCLPGYSVLHAQGSHLFCVTHPRHGTFKAEVQFTAVDLGQMAARKMLEKELQPIWSDSIRIAPFSVTTCKCATRCRVLQVKAKDWDSAPATIDSILAGTKEAFENPGAFVKGALSKAGRMLSSLLD
ncbi:MAG: hypothetical protein ACPF9D_06575 [Owenweeksia sp.]